MKKENVVIGMQVRIIDTPASRLLSDIDGTTFSKHDTPGMVGTILSHRAGTNGVDVYFEKFNDWWWWYAYESVEPASKMTRAEAQAKIADLQQYIADLDSFSITDVKAFDIFEHKDGRLHMLLPVYNRDGDGYFIWSGLYGDLSEPFSDSPCEAQTILTELQRNYKKTNKRFGLITDSEV